MRILMVMDKAFPPDLRVENEALSLVEAGFDVGILLIDPDPRPARETHRGIRLFRERVPGTIRNWMRGLSGTLGLPGRLLAGRIRRLHDEWPFDALHLHDLYLLGGGLSAGRRLGIPVVGDLHENWVDVLGYYRWSTTYPRKLAISIPRWRRLERAWTHGVDRLVVVSDEMADRFAALGVARESIVVVPNTVRIEDYERYPVDPSIIEAYRSPFTVVYTGGMDGHRDLETLIDAWPPVFARFPGSRLVLVGDGRMRARLEERARAHPGIEFPGWQDQSRIRSFIEAANACVIPLRKTVHTDGALPVKLFHYMASARPVVVTDLASMHSVVAPAGAGIVVPVGDAAAMGEALDRLAAKPDEAAAMGRRGAQAVRERWNWEATVTPLLAAYQALERP